MFKRAVTAAAAALALAAIPTISANGAPAPRRPDGFTVAVYGDAPYGTTPTDTTQTNATSAFIDTVNADPDVREVVHVGDIHSGKQFCTEAYDRAISDLWTRFSDPLVYTPGDNEWADCHKGSPSKPGEGGGTYNPTTGKIDYVTDSNGNPVDYAKGDPLANLGLIRSIFFPQPGRTLGGGVLPVLSQAMFHDPRYPTDGQYVENVLWAQRGIVFVTINVPGGSNNDADIWYGTPQASQAQLDEQAHRTAADVRWLDTAFAVAKLTQARGVAIVTQADMWDLDGKTSAHLTGYEPIIGDIAARTTAFGGPVLLFNGDSHVYRSDNPLVSGAPCTGDAGVCSYDAWNSHPTYNVTNFHRVVVHGSTTPLEWLKLHVDPDAHAPASATSFGPFSWTRMPQPQLTP